MKTREIEFPADDPFVQHLMKASGVVLVNEIDLPSPLLEGLKGSGVVLTVPLISQGELVGLLNLGPRRSEQEYSSDDYRLIGNLATQAAPALRVAQWASQRQAEARERERMAHELRVARIVQETLLPKALPQLPGWQLDARWQPARAVSGDLYDFIQKPDGRLVIFAGDVTDKGVPAALVMASVRSILRAASEELDSVGEILRHANDQLEPDIPENMFVTCLCAMLDPVSGRLTFANAGHNPPYQRTKDRVIELRATGMPLGLFPKMTYDEHEAMLAPGDCVLIYSDGLVEAHNPMQEMFGFQRVQELVKEHPEGDGLVEFALEKLEGFTGPEWEQEDDVTLLTISRLEEGMIPIKQDTTSGKVLADGSWNLVAEFSIPSEPGNERKAMQEVAAVVADLGFSEARLERLKTAVAETTLNAMEHGNQYRSELPAMIKVLRSKDKLAIHVTDFGGGKPIPETHTPDLEAKLVGLQSPRGWGLFLIKNMVDAFNIVMDEKHHTVELVFNLEEE
jgi:serine phosphatase RsbU (regulator of sigma subunit)/anti-sigma regulatory factor (Ser/Thr protein kinase)